MCWPTAVASAATYTVTNTNDSGAGSSRFNVAVASDFPDAKGKRFGAIVESQGSAPDNIVVERAMYSNADGVKWAAGTNAVGTRLR